MPIEPSNNRRAQREIRLDHPDQEEPADERADHADQVDRQAPAPSRLQVERPAEDLADLVAIPPDHQPQQTEGQRDQRGIDDQARAANVLSVWS